MALNRFPQAFISLCENHLRRAQSKTQLRKKLQHKNRRLLLEALEERRVFAGFTAGNLAVYRVGTGTGSLTSASAAVFVDEYTPSGTLVQSIAMPTAASGANKALTAAGNSTTEGLLTRSADQNYLVLTGYSAIPGTASIAATTSAATPRVVGRIAVDGSIDTTTALTDYASAGNPRSVASVTGSDLYLAGSTGGLRYTTLGSTTTTQLNTSTNAQVNMRTTAIVDGQLYAGTASGSTYRIGAVGTAIPTTTGQATTSLPGLPINTGSNYQFFLADLSPTEPGVDTLYVADDAAGIGILKYSLVAGAWVTNGSVAGTAATVRGLTGTVSGGTVSLFGATSSTLFSLTDTAGHNATFAGTATAIATAGANRAFRGVALAPQTNVNTAPTFSTIADQTTDEDVPLTVPAFTVTDAETPSQLFRVYASSSNTALIPNANVVSTVVGNDVTAVITPAANQFGTSTIVLRTYDASSLIGTTTFTVTVNAVNDVPVITATNGFASYGIGAPAINLDPLAGFNDVDAILNGGSVTISLGTSGTSTDTLAIRSSGSGIGQIGTSGSDVSYEGVAIGTFAGGTSGTDLVVTLNTSATTTAVQALLRALTFQTSSNQTIQASRTVSIVAIDGAGGASAAATIAVSVGQKKTARFQQNVDFGNGVYTGAADNQLAQNQPTVVLTAGATPTTEGLLVDTPSSAGTPVDESQVLLQFANIFGNGPGQIPLGATIVSAKLVVDTNNPGDGARIHRMLTSWDTATETWNTFGNNVSPRNAQTGVQADDVEATADWVSMVGDSAGSSDTQTLPTTIGVTEDVRAWAAGAANHGWLFEGWVARTDGWGFTSSEGADPVDRPRLDIEWLPANYSTATFQQGENGYSGAVDTVIQQLTPGVSQGTAATIGVDAATSVTVLDEAQTLLRFDNLIGNAPGQIPAGSLIHSAALILTGTAATTAGDGGRFYRMNSAWSDTDTWDSLVGGVQSDGTEAANAYNAQAGNASRLPNVEGGVNAFDVSADVQAWVNGTQNNGWAILPWASGTDGWFFQSSENEVNRDRPSLRVAYTPVGVSITPASGLVTTESGGTATFAVVLNTPPSADVTLDFSSSNTAEGTISVSSITFTPANWNVPQSITVTGVDDASIDGNAAYQIVTAAIVSADPNYNGIDPVDVSISNTDNDNAGFTVNPTSGLVTTEAGGQATFTIVLNSPPTSDVTIGFATSDSTEGNTTVPSIVFTTSNWSVPQVVTVTGADDFFIDGSIAYSIVTTPTSSDSGYNNLDIPDVSLTNTDNDVAGINVTPINGLTTTERGGTATFSVSLTSMPTDQVDLFLSTSDFTEGIISPSFLSFLDTNWNVPQVVTITGVDDTLADGNISYSIVTNAATSFDAAYNGIDPIDVSVVNIDLDVGLVTSSGVTQYGSGLSGVGIDGRIAISGANAYLTNGTLTVSVTANGNVNDRLEIRNEGTAPGQVGVSGSDVSYGGEVVGSYTGGLGAAPLVVTFNSAADVASVQAVARAIMYQDVTVNGSGTRTISFDLVDGDGQVSPTQTKQVRIGLKRVLELQEGVDRGFGVYNGGKDIQLTESNPNTSLPTGGDINGLLVDFPDPGVTNTAQVLLRFESIFGSALGQIPAGAIVTSATLYVQTNNTGDGATLHRMLANWNESTSTWNSFVGGVQPNNIEARAINDSQWNTPDATGATSTGFTSVAVTPDLRAWNSGESNFGWLMNPWSGGTDGWAFSPSEAANPTARPLLRIEWVPAGTSSVVFQQGVNGYTGTVDTVLRQNAPTTSQATSQTLSSDYEDAGGTNRSQPLLRFDNLAGSTVGQIPVNAQIHDAVLTLASVTSDAVGHGGALHPMLTDWTDAATWDSLVAGVTADDVEASSTISIQAGNSSLTPHAQAGFNDFEVITDVQAWVRGTSNRGWAVLPWENGSNAWIFSSSESATTSNRPELEVYFTELPNNAPTDLAVSNSTIDENLSVGSTVGSFSSVDPDPANTFTYELVAGDGDVDNGSFQIVNGQLVSNEVFDFETKSTYLIRVRTTDQGGQLYGALSFEKTLTVTIANTNDAPVVTTTSSSLAYGGTSPAIVDNAIDIVDLDSTDLEGAIVSISAGFDFTEDTLGFINVGPITGSYDNLTGVLTLTGTDSVANYQAALRTITYTNSNAAPTPTTRTISFQVNDGAAVSNFSNSATRDILIGNAVPVVAANSASVSGDEGTTITNAGTWSDADVGNVVTLSASVGNIVKNANGTWDWSIGSTDQVATTSVTITADDGAGGSASTSFTYTVNNLAPTLTRASANVTGNVLTTLTNTGTYADVAADTVTLSADVGTIVNNNNGTWSWSMTPSTAINNQTVTVTAVDEDGGSSTVNFTISAIVAVTNRQVYYKGSAFAGLSEAQALDSAKVIMKSAATTQTTTFTNVTNYSRGINGVVLDVAGLASSNLTAADFTLRVAPNLAIGVVNPSTWAAAPTPSAILVTSGNATTAGHVRLEWTDNIIQNTWLQIIVKANANTGLATPAVFYLGNAVGEINGGTAYRVQNSDMALVQAGLSGNIVSVNDVRDVNKDRRIQNSDLAFVQARISGAVILNNITIPVAGSPEEGASGPGPSFRASSSGSGTPSQGGSAPAVSLPSSSVASNQPSSASQPSSISQPALLQKGVTATKSSSVVSNTMNAMAAAVAKQTKNSQPSGLVDDFFAKLESNLLSDLI